VNGEKIDTRAVRLVDSSIEVLNVANEILMNIDRLTIEESERFLRELEKKDIRFTPVSSIPQMTPRDYLVGRIESIIEELEQLRIEVNCYNIVKGGLNASQ